MQKLLHVKGLDAKEATADNWPQAIKGPWRLAIGGANHQVAKNALRPKNKAAKRGCYEVPSVRVRIACNSEVLSLLWRKARSSSHRNKGYSSAHAPSTTSEPVRNFVFEAYHVNN